MAVFTICWLTPEILLKAVQEVSKGRFSLEQGLAFMLYQTPEVLLYCIPISMLFSTVFLFRQLSLSGELTAMLASGISLRRLLIPIGAVGLGVSLLFFLTQETLLPWAAGELRALNQITHFDRKNVVTPQVTFIERSDSGEIEKFLMISPKAQGVQDKFIFLFYQGKGDSIRIRRIVTATEGRWVKRLQSWHLQKGVDYLLNSNGIYRDVRSFQAQMIPTSPIPQALLSFPMGNPAEFRLKQLTEYVSLLTQGGQTEDARFYEIRLYQRYFLMWVPFVLAVLGAAIGIERSRTRRNLGLTYAALLLLIYNVLVPVSTTLGGIGFLPTILAAFLPLFVAVAGGGAIIQLRKSEG